MTRFAGLLLLCSLSLFGGETTIIDSLNPAFANAVGGNIVSAELAWQSFTAVDGTVVKAGSVTLQTPGGAFVYSVVPSLGSYPFGSYTLTLFASNGQPHSFSVGVPAANGPIAFAQCQITSPWLSWGAGLAPNIAPATSTTGGPTTTSLAGISLSPTVPTDGQAYLFNATSNLLVPVPTNYWRKFTVSYTQLQAVAALTGTIPLVTRVARQKVCGVNVLITSAFAGTGITALSTTVGDSNGIATQYTPVPASLKDNGDFDYNVMGAAVGTGTVQASFTSVGSTLSSLTAGSVDIHVCLVNLQ